MLRKYIKKTAGIFCILFWFVSCVVWKQAEIAETPQIYGNIAELARKSSFDTEKAPESSGVENIFGDADYFITHGDSFCPSSLYGLKFDKNGEIARYDEFPLKGAVQFDWEDMASSFDGEKPTLYLGDIGDNFRFRTRKSIYVISRIVEGKAVVDRRIRFRCVRKGRTVYADTEALFYFKGDLYILTKNYGNALMFRIPLNDGNYVDALCLGTLPGSSRITSAAVNREQTLLAVLSLDFLYLYDISDGVAPENLNLLRVYSAVGCRQCEGVCFTENGDLAITNEQGDFYLLKAGLSQN